MAVLHSRSARDTLELGRRIGLRARPGTVIALEGPLGAGKTTLAKGIARALEVREPVTSPTFTLISEYRGSAGGRAVRLLHVDLYRIRHPAELEDLGLEELLAGAAPEPPPGAPADDAASAAPPGDTPGPDSPPPVVTTPVVTTPVVTTPVVMVEWSEKAAAILPEDAVRVSIVLEADGTRLIRVSGIEP